MPKEAVSEEALVARIQNEITDSLGYGDEISKQRETAMEYYYGLPFGNEIDGRSQFVDSTVQDTIEWIKPSLMRVFASGDDMVKFAPVGPEDVDMAKQATDYVNYVFTKANPGWEILYNWFTDALLSKNGIVKVWWNEEEEWNREEYNDLTELELDALLAEEGVEVIAHSPHIVSNMDDMTGEYTSEKLHNIVIKRLNSNGKVSIENVPPSEFLINRESKSIQDARFVCHRVRKTLSELREMGYDVDADELGIGDDTAQAFSGERQARYDFDMSSSADVGWGPSELEESLRIYWLHENYIRTDYDGDGIAELRKVCTVGSTVLANEPIDSIPFISLCPIRIPHKFFGLSVADQVSSLQLIKSTLMRNLMDNMYNQNFGRYAVLEGQANLDDLLTQRPGGVVRVKSPNAVTPLATPSLQPYSFQMLEYLDGIRESRSGVSKNTQGLNDNALTSHTTASAVAQVMTAAQQRVELIARNFAETGVKELMIVIYELLQKNQDRETVINIRGEWIPINPSSWKEKYDCTVSVGLGHGNRDQQLMHLSQLIQFATQALSGGLGIVNEQNLYNIGAQVVRNMGFVNVQDFLTDPSQQQEPNAKEQAMASESQIKQKELEIKMAEMQIKAQKLQLEQAALQVETQLKVAELKLEAEQKRPVAIGAT
tara:strand:+ start:828 stop:2801 length:1974 start_codon:yes stop_codon:yes gene_type:complete